MQDSLPAGIIYRHGLNTRQQRFVEYFLQGGCNNPYKAALKAGYSELSARTAYSWMVENPKILAEINRRTRATFGALDITTDRIVEETAKMAFANILDFVNIKEDGKFEVDLTKVTRYNAAAIQSLEYDAEGRPRLRLADKKSALELLARYKKYGLIASGNEKDQQSEQAPLTIQKLDTIIQNFTTVNVNGDGRHQLPAQTIEAT